jgi:hypothetical protein
MSFDRESDTPCVDYPTGEGGSNLYDFRLDTPCEVIREVSRVVWNFQVMTKAQTVKTMQIADLLPDRRNANRGTKRGGEMVETSLREYGAGRSILIDKHGRIIAGNKTAKHATGAGLEGVLVVQTDGKQLVAVQRMDLDLDTDVSAQELAIADNRAAQVSLDWDNEVLKGFADQIDLSKFWNADELATVLFLSESKELQTLEQQQGLAYRVIIECDDERHQGQTMKKLEEQGFKCQLLIS